MGLPAVLAALPGLDVDHAHALPHAPVLGGGVALKWPPKECPAAEAGHGSVVDMAGSRLITNLNGYKLMLNFGFDLIF